MTITAKFSSYCPKCRQQIEAGSKVEWQPGSKATHLVCETAAPVSQPARVSVEDAGVYVLADGTIVKAKANKAKTHTYTMRWVEISGQRLNELDAHIQGEYEYAPELMSAVVSSGRRMNLDEAKAFILRYGQCVRCSRHLKDANSVERGLGPVCVSYFSFGTSGASLIASA